MNFVSNPRASDNSLVTSKNSEALPSFRQTRLADAGLATSSVGDMSEAERQIRTHYDNGNIQEGLSLAKNLAKTHRQDETYLALTAAGYVKLKRPAEAVKWAHRALKLNKMSVTGHAVLAVALHMTGNFQASNQHCSQVKLSDPKNTQIRFTEAYNFQKLHDYNKAIELYQELLTFAPNHRQALHNLTDAAYTVGNKELVRDTARRLIAVDETGYIGYFFLAKVSKFNPDDPASITLLRKLLDVFADQTDLDEKSRVATVIATAAEQLGQYDLAFQFFSTAATAKLEADDYSYPEYATVCRKLYSLLDHWSTDPSTTSKQLVRAPRYPILIVGMPRSGTSLTEQILASHSQVYGGGELDDLKLAFEHSKSNRMLNDANAKSLNELAYRTAKSYMASTTKKFGADRHIVDKLPDNYHWSAMILAAMPDARVIFTRRDPMATVWSAFKSNFSASGMGHSRNLKHLVDFYEQSLRFLVRHKELFGDRVYVMNYEKLTEDQENQTRLLLDYCGLEFEEACLEFHKNKRGINTASAQQVVQPMYKGSSQAWRKFEKQLLPYAELLDELDRKYGIDSL